jgi:hypothetical protein
VDLQYRAWRTDVGAQLFQGHAGNQDTSDNKRTSPSVHGRLPRQSISLSHGTSQAAGA